MPESEQALIEEMLAPAAMALNYASEKIASLNSTLDESGYTQLDAIQAGIVCRLLVDAQLMAIRNLMELQDAGHNLKKWKDLTNDDVDNYIQCLQRAGVCKTFHIRKEQTEG